MIKTWLYYVSNVLHIFKHRMKMTKYIGEIFVKKRLFPSAAFALFSTRVAANWPSLEWAISAKRSCTLLLQEKWEGGSKMYGKFSRYTILGLGKTCVNIRIFSDINARPCGSRSSKSPFFSHNSKIFTYEVRTSQGRVTRGLSVHWGICIVG